MSDVAEIYLDGTYAGCNSLFGDDHAEWKAGHIHDLLKDHGIVPETVCEIGCGGGAILVELAKLMPEVSSFTGFEPMPEAFAVAESRSSDRLKFIHETVDRYHGAPFDVACCMDVFEHVEDYFAFLRTLRTKAKTFVFHIPLDMNTQMVLRGRPIMGVRKSVGHIHYFSKDTALAALEDTGFDIVEHRYTAGANERSTQLRSRLLKIPRSLLFSVSKDFAARLLGGYSLLVLAKPTGDSAPS